MTAHQSPYQHVIFQPTPRLLQNMSHRNQTLQSPVQVEGAHTLGVMGVSWAPAVPRGSLTSGKAPGPPARRFATGGCDNTVKVGSRFLLAR